MNREDTTLNSLFSQALSRFGSRVALEMEGQQITYSQLVAAAHRVAHALQELSVGPDVSVALLMSNCFEYVISDVAVMFAGATRIGLNDMLSPDDIRYILNDSGAKVLIVGQPFVSVIQTLQPDLTELTSVVVVGATESLQSGWTSWEDFSAHQPASLAETTVRGDNRAIIVYTGGTTGLPKGVVHQQAPMVMNFLSHVIELGLLDDETLLLTTPLPHTAGFLLNAGLLKGARIIIEPRFNVDHVVQRLQQDGITVTFMVPTMIYRLLDVLEQRLIPPLPTSLRTIVYGAAPITVARLEQGMKWFGSVFLQLYGQSEAPDFITRLRKEDHRQGLVQHDRLASCGQPVMMAEVRIVSDDGHEVACGEVGEVTTKTPYNMAEYLHLPEKTQEVLKDGWLYTGDMGYMDEQGYIYLVDRKKDLIITGGMNVYSSEVENVIQRYPGVLQVAAIGVPDEDWGESVMAVVVADPTKQLDAADILQWCRQYLGKYKRPKSIVFVDTLPVTAYGKMDKKLLRKTYWQGESRQIH